VKPFQIIGNLAGAEVVVLPQVENLADHIRRGRVRTAMGPLRSIAQAGVSVLSEAFPFVERLPTKATRRPDAASLP
jgi:hypothetical protein